MSWSWSSSRQTPRRGHRRRHRITRRHKGAPLGPEKAQEAPPDPEEGTQGAPPDPQEDIQKAPSYPEDETKNRAEPAAGSNNFEEPVVPVLQILTISGNLPPNNAIAHVESAGARRHGRSCVANFSVGDH